MFKNLNHEKLSSSLFDNLIYFLKHYHKSISANTIIEGFPLKQNEKIPDMLSIYNGKPLFVSLARKAGFKSKYVKKDFKDISSLVLPAIIILKDSTSCILEKIDREKDIAVIHVNEFEEIKEEIELSQIEDLYSGEMFLLKKEYFESELKPNLLKKNNEHWFWGTVKKNFSIYKDVVIATVLINI